MSWVFLFASPRRISFNDLYLWPCSHLGLSWGTESRGLLVDLGLLLTSYISILSIGHSKSWPNRGTSSENVRDLAAWWGGEGDARGPSKSPLDSNIGSWEIFPWIPRHRHFCGWDYLLDLGYHLSRTTLSLPASLNGHSQQPLNLFQFLLFSTIPSALFFK